MACCLLYLLLYAVGWQHVHVAAASLLQSTIMAHHRHAVFMIALLYLFWNQYVAMRNIILIICVLAAVRSVRRASWAELLEEDDETALLTALCPTMFSGIPTGFRKARSAWSYRAGESQKKKDEQSAGMWELKMYGRHLEDGTFVPGRWAVIANSNPEYVKQKWRKHFRMDQETFNYIVLQYGGGPFDPQTTKLRNPIPKPKRVAIVLYWLAHMEDYAAVGEKFDVSMQFVGLLAKTGIKYWEKHMVPRMIRIPEGEELQQVMTDFEALCNLPCVAGAIDGTFMRITKPPGAYGDTFYCYKKFSAIIILAVVDALGRFTYLNVGRAGSLGDASTWNMCGLYDGLHDEEDLMAEPREISGQQILPYLVADSAFALSARVIKCYDNPRSLQEEALNYCIIRTRRVVEQAFGRLKGRWQVLQWFRSRDPMFAKEAAKVCCALHNLLERRNSPFDEQLEPPYVPAHHPNVVGAVQRSAESIRQALASHVLPKVAAFCHQ